MRGKAMGQKVVIVFISPLEDEQFQAAIRVAGQRSVSEVFRIPTRLMEALSQNQPNLQERFRNISDTGRVKVESEARDHGRILFDALFANHAELVRDTEPIRLCIEFQVPRDPRYATRMAQAYALPWELLHDGTGFLALRGCNILRQVEGLEGIRTRKSLWLRVLVIAANPHEHGLLELQREMLALQRTLRWSRVFPVFLERADPKSLLEALKTRFEVVHFMGHGRCDGESAQVFLETAEGLAHPLSAASLVHVLSAVPPKNRPQLVVLNACEGAAAFQDHEAVRGMAQELAAAGIPAVLAMRREILDQSAVTFASAFYRALASRKAIEQAVGVARVAVETQQPWLDEWSVPTLFSRHRDGRLLWSALDFFRGLLPLAALLVLALLYWFASANQVILEPGETSLQPALSRAGRILTSRGLEVQTHGFSGNRFRVEQDQRHLTLTGGRYFCGLPFWRWQFQVPTATRPEAGELAQKIAWRLLERLDRPALDLQRNEQGLKVWSDGDYEGAQSLFEQALQENPSLAEAHNNLALLLYRMGLRDEALGHASQAVALAPAIHDFRFNLAAIEGKAADETELDDHLANLHESAKLLLQQRRFGQAARQLRRCLELDPEFAPAHKNLGVLLFAQNRLEAAAASLAKALALTEARDPARLEILLWQARCSRELADEQVSRAALQAFAAIPEATYSAQWPEAAQLADQLGLPLVKPRAVARVGLIGAVTGEAALLVAGRRTLDPRYVRVLTSEMVVSLQAGATLVVIRSDDRVCRLEGPGLWRTEALMQAPASGPYPQYFAQLAAGMLTDAAFAGDYQVLQSRGEEDEVVVLAPRGLACARPELAWVAVPGATAYVLEWGGSDGERHQTALLVEELAAAQHRMGALVYYACAWPWPDDTLQPGQDYSLSLQAVGEDLGQTPTVVSFEVGQRGPGPQGPLDPAADVNALAFGAMLAEQAREPGLSLLYRLGAALEGGSAERIDLAEALSRNGHYALVGRVLDPDFRQRLEPREAARAARCLALAHQLAGGS